MTTFEKIVKGATKIKVAAPKSKYIEPILMATLSDGLNADNFHTIMHTLSARLQDSSWLVVYKALIVIHLMIREGDRDVVLKYIVANNPGMLAVSTRSLAHNSVSRADVRYVSRYAKYLNTRVVQFEFTRTDYVRDERASNATHLKGGRLRSLSVEKGLLRECESVQKQIDALLKSNFTENDVSNDIILTAFRLLVNDLLSLFQALNEGVINLLEHYFEMSKVDASRALGIYRKFVDQTKYVVDFLRIAKHLEHATNLHVPTIKHAPTALTSSLEEYLDDPNFERNRQEYLAEKTASKGSTNSTKASAAKVQESQKFMVAAQTQANTNVQRANSLIVQQATFNPWAGMVAIPQGVLLQQQLQQPMQQQHFQQPMQQQFQQPMQQSMQQPMQQPMQQQPMQQPMQQQQFQQPMQQQQFQQPELQQNQFQLLQAPTQPVQNNFTGFHGQVQPQLTAHRTSNPFLQLAQQLAPSSIQQQQTSQIQQPYQGQVQMPGQSQYGQIQMAAQQAPLPMPQLARSNTNPFLKKSLAPQRTGNNPFMPSETTTQLFNDHFSLSQPQPLVQQATAGGLERLSTIPVFPETQREAQKQFYLNQAHNGIVQQAQNYTPSQMYNANDAPSLI